VISEVLLVIPLHIISLDAKLVLQTEQSWERVGNGKIVYSDRLAWELAATRECAESFLKSPFSGN
jgi:hypothetical protein